MDLLHVLVLVKMLSGILENLFSIGFNFMFDTEFLLEVLGVGFVTYEIE